MKHHFYLESVAFKTLNLFFGHPVLFIYSLFSQIVSKLNIVQILISNIYESKHHIVTNLSHNNLDSGQSSNM